VSPWYHNNELVEDESAFPEGAVGFIYLITRLSDGKAYYGKKLCWFTKTSVKTVTQKNGVKKKKKTRSLVPSDWRTYWSSSANLVADVKLLGEAAFKREILEFCYGKGELSYVEMRYQMDARVLENPDKWYNGIVNARVSSVHIKKYLERQKIIL